jgi:hypothetical protein
MATALRVSIASMCRLKKNGERTAFEASVGIASSSGDEDALTDSRSGREPHSGVSGVVSSVVVRSTARNCYERISTC